MSSDVRAQADQEARRAAEMVLVILGQGADHNEGRSGRRSPRRMSTVVVSGAVHDRRVGSSTGWKSAMPITTQQVAGHAFLRQMYEDSYFPDHIVDKGRAILFRLCERIEAEQPSDLAALYVLTQAATEEFNLLEAEFDAAGSEIETVAREVIAEDFWFVASAYGFTDADVEELIATRDW